MFSVLPDLTPRDCHYLWYVSSRRPNHLPSYLDPVVNHGADALNSSAATGAASSARSRSAQAAVIERSSLGRLLADEAYAERRRANVANMGSTWLKPPGVAKTLFQMNEERREAEEHAEALRREHANQELAEAMANAGDSDVMVEEGLGPATDLDGDLAMDEDGGRDLDDDVPDADDVGFGFDGASDEEDEDDDESEEDEEEENRVGGALSTSNDAASAHQGRQERLDMANRVEAIRQTEDRMRELMARERTGVEDVYGEEVDEFDSDGQQGDILEEEDLGNAAQLDDVDAGMDMDMDADLDADIPEAQSGYEHTDSDVSETSHGEYDDPNASNLGVVGRVREVARYRTSFARSDGTRQSLNISSILSRDGSSMLGNSPEMRRRA